MTARDFVVFGFGLVGAAILGIALGLAYSALGDWLAYRRQRRDR